MRAKSLTVLALAGLVTVGMATAVQADETGGNRNLFETAGTKQSAEDFEPAPRSPRAT